MKSATLIIRNEAGGIYLHEKPVTKYGYRVATIV
jgi:hypothetical protein